MSATSRILVVFVILVCTMDRAVKSEARTTKYSTQDDELSPILRRLAALSRDQKEKREPLNDPCESADCVEESVAMQKYMARPNEADPCEDFYEYACGGWLKQKIPGDHAVVDVFTTMTERIENRLKTLIENQKENKDKIPVQMAFDWYSACLDIEERNKLGTAPLLKLLKDTMKSEDFVPFVSEPWSGENWDLVTTLARINRNSSRVMPFFSTTLSSDSKNTSSPAHITITQPKLLIGSESVYLLKNRYSIKMVLAYLGLMVDLGKLLGETNIRQLLEDVSEIILFDALLAKEIIYSDESSTQAFVSTVRDLTKIVPEFDWLRYFNELFDGIEGQKPITEDEVVYVESPKYFTNAMFLISKVRKSVLANYIAWQLIYEYSPYLSEAFHETYLSYAEKIYGLKKGNPLWRRCVRSTMKSMDMALAYLYVNDSMTNQTIQTTIEMVDHLKAAFIENLDKVKWMDDITREAAEEKAEAMFQQIGYPDFITNMTQLEEYFRGIVVNHKTFFENNILLGRVVKMNTLGQRGRVPYRYSWDMRPTEPNAYYSPNVNKIVVSAAIMQTPFFDKSFPEALNYGALGFVVGHELTHGFDDNGAKFDKDGNLRNWWSKISLLKFKRRIKCMEREYSDFKVLSSHIDGKQTLGENIADNGGLKFAYMAYKKWQSRHGEDLDLPNVHLSHDQLFFLSFAQVWCEKSTDSFSLNQLKVDEHSPAKYRVMGTLKNSKAFSKAFNCARGSGMNPKKKCMVW